VAAAECTIRQDTHAQKLEQAIHGSGRQGTDGKHEVMPDKTMWRRQSKTRKGRARERGRRGEGHVGMILIHPSDSGDMVINTTG
jgi:hypothetical protein